jgi:hypothetical protein
MSTSNSDVKNRLPTATATFDPMAAMKIWQKSASRLARVREVLISGFVTTTRMEVELGQTLMQSQMSAFKHITPGEKPEAIMKAQMAHQVEDSKHVFAAMHKISEEIRQSFTEATRTLLDTEESAAVETSENAIKAAATPAQKSVVGELESRGNR